MSIATLEQVEKSTHDIEAVSASQFRTQPHSRFVDEGFILPSPPVQPRPMPDEQDAKTATDGSEDNADRSVKVNDLIRLTAGKYPSRQFQILQQWEGVVSHVEGDSVWAEIRDLSNPTNPTEVVEIPLAEIPKPDLSLLNTGCVFYWSIGYETRPGGQLLRVSEIRVRRTPEWSPRAVELIKEKGKELFMRINAYGKDESTENK